MEQEKKVQKKAVKKAAKKATGKVVVNATLKQSIKSALLKDANSTAGGNVSFVLDRILSRHYKIKADAL